MKKAAKTISVILSIFIAASSVSISAAAASQSSIINAVVSAAENEVGYTGTTTYSKYGKWYGYQGSWCTTFILWCFNKAESRCKAELYGEIVPSGGNCNSMISWFENNGRYRGTDSYTPKKGDLVFFDWNSNGSSDHVGIVTATEGKTVYTVEGNCSGKVKERSYTATGSKPYNNISSIMGYASPNYALAADDSDTENTTANKHLQNNAAKNENKTESPKQPSVKSTATTSKSDDTADETDSAKKQKKLKSLEIYASTYDLQVGDTVRLNYTVEPSGVQSVVGYFCDEEGIIEIGSNGDIKAVGPGTATVVVCANNDLYKQCDFTVNEAVAAVTKHTSDKSAVTKKENNIDSAMAENAQSVLMEMGVNIEALSKNKTVYVIPATIVAATAVISLFIYAVKRIKEKIKNK